MIYLTTGGNGAGKTLITLKDVREQQLKEGRPVYYHGFTAKPILKEWGWQEFDPKKWQDLPDGSVCVFDECQNEFPAKIQGELPDYINAVAQYRRKRGFDFWMITPHPSLIHLNIRRLIESPSWHRHLKRVFGTDRSTEIRFNYAEMRCELPGSGKNGQTSTRSYPKDVYDWYESASLHTGKKKIPKQVWLVGAGLVVAPVLGFFAWQKLSTMGQKPGQVSAKTATDSKTPQTVSSMPAARYASATEYLEMRNPRIPDLPQTAPVYDEVTKPVTAPYPAACVQDAKRCNCYTQQGTLLRTSGEVCKQIVQFGYFVDWDVGKSKRESEQNRERQYRQNQGAYQVQQQAPRYQQQQPELIGFEERMAARNASVVSSLKR